MSLHAACRTDTHAFSRRRAFSRIALVGIGKDHPTWPVLQATAQQVAGRGGRLEIVVRAPDTASPRGQQEILKDLSAAGNIEAVCIHPLDPSAVAPDIQDLVQKGISVVTFGTDVPIAARNGYCGPLETEIGRAAAQACELLVKGHSNSIILLYAGREDPFYGARYNAFKAQLPATSGVSILRELDCHRNRLDALELVKSESRKYPRVAGWVLLDDWPLRVLAPEAALLPKGCGMVLCNADPRYNEHLRDGRIEAIISYDFRDAVQQALFAAIRLGDDTGKKAFASEISVAPEIITRQDLPFWEARWKAWQTGQPPPTTWPAENPSQGTIPSQSTKGGP